MAFNFNWSPLTADENFYQRATEMLTAALNKSPKPPLIADDILVTEMNLGNDPPELDILEIGDIAEDRFRGIFKMSYRGDAFLTLKTKVQANPMNTYLHSKPTFTSPKPLAAQSGLTIPLSITLSEFKLSGFIILVFSKQKGLTIVFRNDPLESLKVSSTFDPIQFVRDYLQKTIEDQLRNLFMEELPAIIHRLSLRLWCPDQLPKENEDVSDDNEEDDAVVDPLAKAPADAVDAQGNLLDVNELANLSLEGGSEMPSLFSQKNLLKIAALRDSHRTLSLFTPGLKTAVLRATSGAGRSDNGNSPPLLTPSLSKVHSFSNGHSHTHTATYTFSETSSATNGQLSSRPSLSSATSTSGLSATGRSRSYMGGRKKKQRVVRTPLRRARAESQSTSCSTSDVGDSTCTDSASVQGPMSEEVANDSIPEETGNEEDEPQVRFKSDAGKTAPPSRPALNMDMFTGPDVLVPAVPIPESTPGKEKTSLPPCTPEKSRKSEKTPMHNSATFSPPAFTPAFNSPGRPMPADGILEQAAQQAWISKMASEIARRVYEEKARNDGFWETGDNDVPPPYEPAQ